MSLALQAHSNQTSTNDASMLDCSGLPTTLRDGDFLATLNGRHRRSCILQLSAESDRGWARERLSVQLVTRQYKKLLTSREVIHLS